MATATASVSILRTSTLTGSRPAALRLLFSSVTVFAIRIKLSLAVVNTVSSPFNHSRTVLTWL